MDLYDLWKKTVDAHSAEIALVDIGSGRRWTFREIQAEVDGRPAVSQLALFPGGMDIDLIFETLRGWRDRKVVCPVDDVLPPLKFFENLPEEIAHAKTAPGSWAKERIILFRAGQIAADCRQVVAGMKLRPDRPNIGVLSMAHSYGFTNLVLPLLLEGIPLHWCGDTLPGAVNRALDSTGPATLPAVPALWRAWFDSGILENRNLFAISAGAPLNLDLEHDVYNSTGIKIHNFYGASECGGIAFDSSEVPRNDGDCLGAPLEGVELEATAEGIHVTGPSVAEGYWPAQGSPGFQEQGFHLSDRGEVDEDGQLRMIRRRRDLINVAGRKVYPAAVEHAIESVDGVQRCVVFGVEGRNPERVEEVAACIQLSGETTVAAVRRALRGKLMRYEIPHYWWEPPELSPELDVGVSREELRAQLSSVIPRR